MGRKGGVVVVVDRLAVLLMVACSRCQIRGRRDALLSRVVVEVVWGLLLLLLLLVMLAETRAVLRAWARCWH